MFWLQDEAQADRGGLRDPQEVLREADRGEPEATEGVAGDEVSQILSVVAVVHAAPGGHPRAVPVLPED